MSQVFSEINKINNAYTPGVSSSGVAAAPGNAAYETDTLHLENYKNATFIVTMGTAVAATHWNFKVMAGSANTTGTGAATPINFYYRAQGTTDTAYVDDIPGALTAGTSDGIDTTTGYVGGVVIIEVDAPTVAAAGTNYDHVKLHITGTTAADAPRAISIVAILSEPRYPQAVLATAID